MNATVLPTAIQIATKAITVQITNEVQNHNLKKKKKKLLSNLFTSYNNKHHHVIEQHFGRPFFASLETPADASLSASWASLQTGTQAETQTGKTGLSKQVGTYNGVTNGSQFDWNKEGAEQLNKLSHVKTHMDYTVKNTAE